MAVATLKDFHVPLPEELHSELRSESRRLRRPATMLVREAIAFWLNERRKQSHERDLRDYARRWGGTETDLDRALVEASLEHLRES